MVFKSPGFTQIPNEYYDHIAKTLGHGENLVLGTIMRLTFGWGNKEWDKISYSQLQERTGLSRDSVWRALKSLIEKKFIERRKQGPKGREQCEYKLCVEEPDISRNSNNVCWSGNQTGTSQATGHTKERVKEIRKEIYKEKEIPVSNEPVSLPSKRKNIKEEMKEKCPRVWISDFQHESLVKKENGIEANVIAAYEKLSTWKIGKGIEGGRKDYQAIVGWVLGAIKEEKTKANGKSKGVQENKSYAKEVYEKFRNNHDIRVETKTLEFWKGSHCFEVRYDDHGFKEQVENQLRKMGIKL